MKVVNILGLKREARLFDSYAYIIKGIFAVGLAYIIASNNSLLKRDMISVLFGLMLTIEPVTVTGIRNGFNQVYASLLGAVGTSVIIYFLGINYATIAVSVGLTLFICLKIDWREVSPVAVFTSIYMTQYVQLDSMGNPSVFETFKLRMAALLFGVFIAVLSDFIFSIFSYKNMSYKRVGYIASKLSTHATKISNGLIGKNRGILEKNSADMANTFELIDWVYNLIEDKKIEKIFYEKIIGSNSVKLQNLQSIVLELRKIAHYLYDINLEALNSSDEFKIENEVLELSMKISEIEMYFERKGTYKMDIKIKDLKKETELIRAEKDLFNIKESIKKIQNIVIKNEI